MKSPVVKRSVVLAGHKTSVSLENAFWQGLKEIATSRRITLSDLIPASTVTASTVISRRLYGCLCSVTTKPRSVTWGVNVGRYRSGSTVRKLIRMTRR